MRRLISYILCASLVFPLLNLFAPFAPQAQAQDARNASKPNIEAGIQRIKNDTRGAALVSISGATGAARFVRMSSGSEASLIGGAGNAQDKSDAFFRDYGSAFGVTDASDLKMVSDAADAIGGRHLTYGQYYRGVPVFAGVLKTHFDAAGNLYAVNGNFIPDVNLNPAPSRKADEAAAVALERVKADPGDGELAGTRSDAPLAVAGSTLYVYRANLARGVPGPNHLVWEVKVGNGADVRDFVYVDAHTLKVVEKVSGHQDALNRRAYDGMNLPNPPPDYPAGPEWVEGQPFPTGTPELDNMVIASGETYNLFFNAFNRDSYDGAGHVMDSIYNRGYSCPNASWNGTFISFCVGLTTDDITAHEWGHAYTEYTHGLIYQWQPGALNESYSDIWGETVDRINNRDNIGNSATDPARTVGSCSSHSPAVAQLIINSPPAIAGTYPAQPAAFGPPLTGTGVTGHVVLAVDDNAAGGTDPNDGCGNIAPGSLTGKIALMRRGLCNFSDKVYRAQQAGAIAAIIFNNSPTGLPGMGAGVNAGLVTIPSVGVTQAEGNAMIANASATEPNVTIRSSSGAVDNSTRWLLGEDATHPQLTGALRDMWNPTCYANPGKVTDTAYYLCSTADNGGVHINSGIPNHAFALLVDGGTYNGQTVTAIGLTKAAHIYYRAQTVYQHPASDFPDHADSIEQSATDLIGQDLKSLTTGLPSGEIITAADVDEVKDAVLAVELRTPPTFCGFQPLLAQSPPADSCSAGTSKAVIFSDDFEGDNSDWAVSHIAVNPVGYSTPDWVATNALPDNRTGTAFFAANPDIGSCTPADDESGVQSLDSPTISIPSTVATPILRFDHWVATEPSFDGGQLLISVNGGAYTLVPQAAFIYNAHNLVLATVGAGNTNPKAGQRAWSGTDGGAVDGTWGTSVVDLSLAGVSAGNTVKLRYDMSQDGCGGRFGWYVDNVQIAACLADIDLQVVKTASSHRVLIGDEVTYTVVATNNGPGLATSVGVVDTFVNGDFVSAQVSQGAVSQNGNTVTAHFGDIANGASATLTVVVKASHRGKLSNTAVVSAFEPDTVNTGNNSDTEITRVVTLHRLDFVPGRVTGGCGTSTGTVRLTEAAPAGGVLIDLQSSSPNITIPAQVTVPGGQSFVTFQVAPTSPVLTRQLITVTATLHDEPTVSVTGRVALFPAQINSITFSPSNTVQGGTVVTGTVGLSCVAQHDIVVKLSTTNNIAKPDQAQITIPQGASSAQFTIHTKHHPNTVTAIISAKAPGAPAKRAPLTVTP